MNESAQPSRLDVFTPVVTLQRTSDEPPASFQVAGAGARSLAGIIDLVLQAILFVFIAHAVMHWNPALFPRETWPWAIPLAFIELHIIYLMLFESIWRGRTPGLALLGLRVISARGGRPQPLQSVKRNLTRLLDLLLGGYAYSFVMMNHNPSRQSLGDRIAGTQVIYNTPLREQMASASVPESFYSTSEAGYLLQAWIERNSRMDHESKAASALDLGAYLHSVYEPEARDLPDPATYLHGLFEKEMADCDHSSGIPTNSSPIKSE